MFRSSVVKEFSGGAQPVVGPNQLYFRDPNALFDHKGREIYEIQDIFNACYVDDDGLWVSKYNYGAPNSLCSRFVDIYDNGIQKRLRPKFDKKGIELEGIIYFCQRGEVPGLYGYKRDGDLISQSLEGKFNHYLISNGRDLFVTTLRRSLYCVAPDFTIKWQVDSQKRVHTPNMHVKYPITTPLNN